MTKAKIDDDFDGKREFGRPSVFESLMVSV